MEEQTQTIEQKKQKVAEEYLSSLADLNVNSKPLINMLTILAEENIEHASVIVNVVEQHIAKVHPDVKLPVLYLIDSIIKNVKRDYVRLFSNCIVNIFCGVFEKVVEKVREKMYTLRQTWNDVFPSAKLYALDIKVNCMDPNWPVTAKMATSKPPAIHVNPNFLKPAAGEVEPNRTEIEKKTRQLLELEKRKLELELEATKLRLQEQEKQLSKVAESVGGALPVQSVQNHPYKATRPPHMPTVNATRPNMFHPYRGPVPRPPNMMNEQNIQPGMPPHMQKPRVHPVNSAMLQAVRHRDPRLARQQQNQQSSIPPLMPENAGKGFSNEETKKHRADKSKSSSDYSDRSDRSKMKSRSGSSDSSRNSSSSRKVGRDKSSKSLSSPDRKKPSSKSSTRNDSKSSRKDSSSSKRSSRSPSQSPRKVLRTYERSRKPQVTSTDSAKDVDFRSLTFNDKRTKLTATPEIIDENGRQLEQSSTAPATTNSLSNNIPIVKDLDQNLETHSSKDVDLREFPVSASTITSPPHSSLATTSVVEVGSTSSEPTTTTSLVSSSSSANNLDNSLSVTATKVVSTTATTTTSTAKSSSELGDELKKRPMKADGVSATAEPSAKKSKSEKIDMLFGSQDVDLRTAIQPLVSSSSTVGVMTPPPPPIISTETENWSRVKEITQPQTKISPKKTTLDDVRAKLAKTAAIYNETEKPLKKLKALAMATEDPLEGKDEQIRTIINQANELFENGGISSQQRDSIYKNVIQDYEKAQLEKAQRRESLTSANSKEAAEEAAESAARQAILRKRIPKKSKESSQSVDVNMEQSSILQRSSASPPVVSNEQTKSSEKRSKPSKWSSNSWDGSQPKVQPSSGFNQQTMDPRLWAMSNNNRSFNNARGGAGNIPPMNNRLGGLPNHPWQNNIPNMIFANNPIQIPVQPMLSTGGLPELPASLPRPSNSIDNPQSDLVRSITIDSTSKEIRIYDDVAIVFMDWDQPREIGFKSGQRRIWIDDLDPVSLEFNDDYKTVIIKGKSHKIRFGFPSRELYIDDNWYECFFGGRSIQIPIGNSVHILKAEGPPPQVNIGDLRPDLVVGKINLIIDARIIIPVFLDAKVQYFDLDDAKHTIQFADSLKTVLIDAQPMKVEYGGLPQSLRMGDKKYFVRFGALPHGVVPGKIRIKDMIRTKEENIDELSRGTSSPAAIDMDSRSEPMDTTPAAPVAALTTTAPTAAVLNTLNIDELFQKLISSGVLNTQTSNSKPEKNDKDKPEDNKPKEQDHKIKPIDLGRSESIKSRQKGIVQSIYTGMQCSSCGVRFPPEQTIKYSQHLDWHFRQNRRERDSSRKAHSRKWYYDLSDWIQYEEIEDLEEREKNFFETQQGDLDQFDNTSNQQQANSPITSCPAGADDVDRDCDVCHERFEQFYNEELEEWHLKSAIRVDDKFYHPICYDDYKASLTLSESTIMADDDNAVDNVIIKKEEEEEAKLETDATEAIAAKDNDDDDDDVIVVPTEEPSITEIPDDDDDEEYVPTSVSISKPETSESEDESKRVQNESIESDVEIQEPNIPFTDLDNYEERNLSGIDESSQSSQLLAVKIKEEPKDDYEDEDDGFEDVGTVVHAVDDVSILSCDDTVSQSQTILSSPSNSQPATAVSSEPPSSQLATIDGNVPLQDSHPALVGVNKIKINITKSIVSSNNTNLSNSSPHHTNELSNDNSNISTIPVLCSGNSNLIIPSSISHSLDSQDKSVISVTVDGADGSSSYSPRKRQQLQQEPTIEFEFKPALRSVDFKKTPKVNLGLDTSGLCSIM